MRQYNAKTKQNIQATITKEPKKIRTTQIISWNQKKKVLHIRLNQHSMKQEENID